jgi:hypothetical protein
LECASLLAHFCERQFSCGDGCVTETVGDGKDEEFPWGSWFGWRASGEGLADFFLGSFGGLLGGGIL